jgi:hypothetical protein
LAVTPTEVVAATAEVWIVKFAEDCPAGIVTLAGAESNEESVESPTLTPPVGAGLSNWTVPVTGVPPVTVAGLTLRTAGETVRVAVTVFPPETALMVTVFGSVTDCVLIEKLAV